MKVEEPLVAYGLPKNTLQTDISLIREARKGIKTAMFWEFLNAIGSSKSEFEDLLPNSIRTFNRKEVLDEATSERILNIIRVYKKGEEVFEDIEAFKNWLHKYHPILGDHPLQFLKTSTGCQVIIDELGRIEHGILA